MLFSLHIPKTAGTAWRLYLEQNIADQASFVSPEPRDRDTVATQALARLEAGDADAAKNLVERSGIGLIAGHQAEAFLDLWPDAPAVAWIRHPVDRVISEYLHLRARPQPNEFAQKVLSGEITLGEFGHAHSGDYTRLAERLKNRPAPYCFFLTEKPALALEACRDFAGWAGDLPQRNVTPPSHFDTLGDVDEARKVLAEVLPGEIALYRKWESAWTSGEARRMAGDVLSAAPHAQSTALVHSLRRHLGIAKEKLGHWLGRDWR